VEEEPKGLTCYFRHLGEVFRKAEIEVTKENRKEIGKLIQDMMGVKYSDCPATWKKVKERLAKGEDEFAAELKKQWTKKKRIS
jgi:hypothetical protein